MGLLTEDSVALTIRTKVRTFMNILYINHYAGSVYLGMEFRPYYLAREWVKTGHKVRIIGADFSHLRTVNPTVEKDFEIENIDGI